MWTIQDNRCMMGNKPRLQKQELCPLGDNGRKQHAGSPSYQWWQLLQWKIQSAFDSLVKQKSHNFCVCLVRIFPSLFSANRSSICNVPSHIHTSNCKYVKLIFILKQISWAFWIGKTKFAFGQTRMSVLIVEEWNDL